MGGGEMTYKTLFPVAEHVSDTHSQDSSEESIGRVYARGTRGMSRKSSSVGGRNTHSTFCHRRLSQDLERDDFQELGRSARMGLTYLLPHTETCHQHHS